MRSKLAFIALFVISCVLAACASPTPTAPVNKPLFADDFSQDNGLWETFIEDGATAQLVDGQLALANNLPSRVTISVAALNVADFDLTVEATFVEGGSANSYGVLFRYLNDKSFYRLDFTDDGYWGVSRRMDENWISISELAASPALHTGLNAQNLIRLTAQGDTFTVYANGRPLGTVTDSAIEIGRLGVFVSTFDDPTVQARFDNVRVIKP